MISLSKLDISGLSFKIRNDCFSSFKNTHLIGSSSFSDGFHKLKLGHVFTESLLTVYHNVGIKHNMQNERSAFCGINIWVIYPKEDWKY